MQNSFRFLQPKILYTRCNFWSWELGFGLGFQAWSAKQQINVQNNQIGEGGGGAAAANLVVCLYIFILKHIHSGGIWSLVKIVCKFCAEDDDDDDDDLWRKLKVS